ncbi:MAG: HAMP domain-containing protein [Chitinivibrionales bacterium]|nr:HAMP domain-containing protein [Chitinivibrionales bacterium]MBD3396878.1 HAMP domain-containing protein [Chitinivibrionales bacterium]
MPLRFQSNSILFKTGLIYLFVTLLNILLFVLMVFENQLDLIVENSVLNAMHKGSSLKYRIDTIIEGKRKLTPVTINKILKEAGTLAINTISLFREDGKVYVAIKDNRRIEKDEATLEDLKMINMAITKRGFEDKLFYHKVDEKKKHIALYVPFNFELDKIGIAAIDVAMKDIDRQRGYLYRQCVIMAALIVFIHVVFALILTKMFIIPLRNLMEATHRISRGELDTRVPIVRDDEIGQLATSFNEMSVALQRMRDEAKGANPLTGLPGNITIAKYIDDCLAAGRIICVLYCDLDNFKAYNDKYGFTKGDEAILYTRDCLMTVAQRKDMQNVFVGHEGGDDFVVVCGYEFWEAFAKHFITTFDRGIYQFYNSIDARNGFIESINRQGQRQRFPLMSISIAVVTNKTRPFRRHAEMIQVAAEVKKYVKSMDGSCYAIDRRQGSVSPTQRLRQPMPGA